MSPCFRRVKTERHGLPHCCDLPLFLEIDLSRPSRRGDIALVVTASGPDSHAALCHPLSERDSDSLRTTERVATSVFRPPLGGRAGSDSGGAVDPRTLSSAGNN